MLNAAVCRFRSANSGTATVTVLDSTCLTHCSIPSIFIFQMHFFNHKL